MERSRVEDGGMVGWWGTGEAPAQVKEEKGTWELGSTSSKHIGERQRY